MGIHELHRIRRTFGPKAARAKLRLLERIAAGPRPGKRDAAVLAETVEFLRAYPDDAALRRAVGAVLPLLPPLSISHDYSYGVLRRLIAAMPGRLEIDWDGLEDEARLVDVLDLLVLPGESDGVVDPRVSLRDWFDVSRPARNTHLEHLVDLMERTGLPERVRVHLFEMCEIPVVYRGPRRCDLALETNRVRFQRTEMGRESFPLPGYIRRPAGRASRAGGRTLFRFALQALCARRIEIYPLIHGSPADVTSFEGARGIRVVLIGVEPVFRCPLESLYFFLLLKNGVPVAYGPASVFGGCCEMGINLFPEFRGGEIRYLYAELMRVLHHRLGADYFFLTRYGMGENNEEAIDTGAFWFYRKLGFRPSNPEVEALARSEEARRAADPGYRSDRRMLRRLSHTEAYLDLSGGRRRPLDLARLSMIETSFVARDGRAGRSALASRWAARAGRLLGLDPRARALRTLAPVLCLIPDLARWSRRELDDLSRFVRAKDAASEAPAARIGARHHRLAEALHAIVDRGPIREATRRREC